MKIICHERDARANGLDYYEDLKVRAGRSLCWREHHARALHSQYRRMAAILFILLYFCLNFDDQLV